MIWIVLAALGVPVWLLVGGLLYALRLRRRVRRTPGMFPCRLRPAGPAVEEARWSRAKQHAGWVHDVLLVHRGPALARYEAFAVASVSGPVAATTVKGLGEMPSVLRLHLDDGRLIDLAVRSQNATPATGPFVVASMR
jgi:hypothetical protein